MSRACPARAGLSLVQRVCAALLPCLAGAAIVAAQAPAGGDQQSKAIALIARAAQLQNLSSPDAGPFRLRASVKLFGLMDGSREGSYFLQAASPTQWFEQVRFPGYSELTGLSDSQAWRKRNVIDKPYRFHEVTQLLNPAHHLKLPESAEITKLWQKEIRGVTAYCIEASPTHDLWQKEMAGTAAMGQVGLSKESKVTLCFDPTSGALMSADYSASLPRFEYEGQVALGNKVFPKILRCYEANELVVEATVQELVAAPNQDPAGFAPPIGTEKWSHCESPELPRLVEKKPMDQALLVSGKARHQFGTVLCIAEIGTDGLIHDFAVVQHRGVFTLAVMDAVKKLRYAPATCDGVPVPTGIYLAFVFPP
jgi:hypothetical protein